ncbi:MAG: adenylate kinase [Pseudomonadota bacterium]
MRIVLLGAPGSGKGTQAALLKDHFSIPHVSTGELLRAAVRDETELGLKAKAIMERGELVSDDLVLGMLRERLLKDDCGNGFILDGYPRNVAQAEALNGLLTELNQPVDHAVLIHVDASLIIDRLSKRAQEEGRSDDTAETVKRRLDVYEEQTAPVIGYYRDAGKVDEVDGVGTVEDVFERVAAVIRQ